VYLQYNCELPGSSVALRLRPEAEAAAAIGIRSECRVFPLNRQCVQEIVRRAATKAALSLDRAHLHTLRTGFAIAYVPARVPVRMLAVWSGH